MSERGIPLRQTLLGRITKKTNVPYEHCNEKQRFFVDQSVETLIRSGMLTMTAVDEVARIFKQKWPPGTNKGPYHPQPPMAVRDPTPQSAPQKPTAAVRAPHPPAANRPPETARDPVRGPQRVAAVEREARLVRDEKWAKEINHDVQEFERRQAQEREAAATKKEEQRRFLESQMVEVQRKKKEAEDFVTAEARRVHAETAKELEEERKEKEAARRKMVEERNMREGILAEHSETKRSEKKQRIENEKKYIQSVIDENEAKRTRDFERREKERRDLRKFLSENTHRMKAKALREEEQRRRENTEIERIRAIQAERERGARDEMMRKTEKGMTHTRKIEAILKTYEHNLEEQEALERQREQRRHEEAEVEEQRKTAVLDAKQRKKKELQQELIHSLESQMKERDAMKASLKAETREFRQNMGSSFLLGSVSNQREKEKVLEDRRRLQQALDSQIADREARRRQDISTGIGRAWC